MQPPIFIAFANGDVQAFATQKEAESYFDLVEDAKPAHSRAWDSTGAILEIAAGAGGKGMVLIQCGRAAEPETLRAVLVSALDTLEPGALHDGPLEEVVAMAAGRFRAESSGWPCAVALVALVGVGAAVGYFVLRR